MCNSITCKPSVFFDMLVCKERTLMWIASDPNPPICNKDDIDIETIAILGED